MWYSVFLTIKLLEFWDLEGWDSYSLNEKVRKCSPFFLHLYSKTRLSARAWPERKGEGHVLTPQAGMCAGSAHLRRGTCRNGPSLAWLGGVLVKSSRKGYSSPLEEDLPTGFTPTLHSSWSCLRTINTKWLQEYRPFVDLTLKTFLTNEQDNLFYSLRPMHSFLGLQRANL